MSHIVTDNCTDCRYTDCVSTCPVACFHSDDKRLYIDPDVCIDCSACITECPVQAIYDTEDMPEEYEDQIEINATASNKFPVIESKLEPLSTAEEKRAALGF